jgi:hypothetical protein
MAGYKFKVGDEVVAILPPDGDIDLVGLHGIIENIEDGRIPIMVNFTTKAGRSYHWWCEEDSLRPLKSNYVIYDDPRTLLFS